MRLIAWSSLVISFFLLGCESEYSRLVKREYEKGERYDSLLFDINLGDTRKEFYGKCWLLNKKELIMQGPNNNSVQYVMKDSLFHKEPTKITLLFFPGFDKNESINSMNMEFSYPGWSPLNKSYHADSLMVKVIDLMMHWYGGNEFIEIDFEEENRIIPVKVDGNRRIIIGKKDDQVVLARIHDIYHPDFKHNL